MSKAMFCIALMLVMVFELNAALPMDKEKGINEFDPMDDYGTMDAALIDYLFKKQLAKRLRSQMDIGNLQRKRFYWKHCAFNAVSCFGQ